MDSQSNRYPNNTKITGTKHGWKFGTTLENALNSIEQLWRLGLQRVYAGNTEPRERKREKRHEKQSDLLLHSRNSNSLLIKNAKPLLQECVCILRGKGALQMHGVWGRELVPVSLPSQLGILLTAPLPSPQAPTPVRSFFLAFRESSFWVLPIVASEGTDLLRGGLGSLGSHCQVSPVGAN